ncbi:RNA polymerase sigma factor [Actinoplanes sp. NEAU-A12]|uniref:RNA polymerase sigma factor n=1 Tax=Actinoplanes sandaracinus TaxID=3045177 RepID=A0ABT6WRL6_9ACTN|nr:RNA polymerase sigma factor [Actinoplanes sandaracinus]MDI6102369.1 RNA polymerase sigma factor [Actinoplanes sandaracinus]
MSEPGNMENQLTPGELEAFVSCFKKNFHPLTWFVIRAGASVTEAPDVVQEAMLAALKSWATVQNPRAFLHTAALRILHRRWDKAKQEHAAHQRIAQETSATAFDMRLDVNVNLDVADVLSLLRELPQAQREAFALHADGFTPPEIAEITGQKASTARSNVRHARQKLLRMIEESTRKEAGDGP